jgi:hypothetical protein
VATRRRVSSLAAGESILTDQSSQDVEVARKLRCQGEWSHSPPLPRAKHPQTSDDPTSANGEDSLVVDDLGECVPVCTAELDVIEMYLDHILLELLDRNKPARKADEG